MLLLKLLLMPLVVVVVIVVAIAVVVLDCKCCCCCYRRWLLLSLIDDVHIASVVDVFVDVDVDAVFDDATIVVGLFIVVVLIC